MPYSGKDLKNKPLKYFTHIFGHEGQNSLLSILISKGLALTLESEGTHELHSFSTFQIEITLTKKGLENWEQVVEDTFQYTQRLWLAGPQDQLFQECHNLGRLEFAYSEKEEAILTCIHLSQRIQIMEQSNMEQILRSKHVADEFDHGKIDEISNLLCKPN